MGYDGSQGAEQALEKALSIVDEAGEIILLAVVPTYSEKTFLDKKAYKRARKKARVLIKEKMEEMEQIQGDITFRGSVKKGEAADQIITFADKWSCDLIVLGHRGTSEIGSQVLGSVADKVVHHAYKPVMVVR